MLKMAIIETQIFKILWGSMPPDLPRKLAPSALDGAPPPPPLTKSWIRPLIVTAALHVNRLKSNWTDKFEKTCHIHSRKNRSGEKSKRHVLKRAGVDRIAYNFFTLTKFWVWCPCNLTKLTVFNIILVLGVATVSVTTSVCPWRWRRFDSSLLFSRRIIVARILCKSGSSVYPNRMARISEFVHASAGVPYVSIVFFSKLETFRNARSKNEQQNSLKRIKTSCFCFLLC